jgi:hypothetical protein
MSIEEVVEGLVHFGEGDWIALWIIVDDVAQELGLEDSQAQLEATLAVVRELLRRGFLAGESPASSSGIHFLPWPNQNPDAVVELIRRQWAGKPDYPDWGDGPWFAAPQFCRFDA